MSSDGAVLYLLGLISGWLMGALAAVLVLRPGDGWQDVLKRRTKLQMMQDAGIGVAKKSD